MRKILSAILAVMLCFCLTGCSGSKIPLIYQTIATKFIDNMCTMSSEEVKSLAESAELELKKESYGYNLSNGGKWKASFNSTGEEFKVLSFHNWGKDHSIYISQSSIYYISGDYIKYFNSLADCEQYVFGETSGIDFKVEKMD